MTEKALIQVNFMRVQVNFNEKANLQIQNLQIISSTVFVHVSSCICGLRFSCIGNLTTHFGLYLLHTLFSILVQCSIIYNMLKKIHDWN